MEILSKDTVTLLKDDKVKQAVRTLVEKEENHSDQAVSVTIESPTGATTVSLKIAST